jgi:hypothetical protein
VETGTYVRHRAKPNWGIGKVVSAPTDDYCIVEFEAEGLKKLSRMLAEQQLEVLDAAVVPIDHPLRVGGERGRVIRGPATAKCVSCQKPLNRSIYSSNRRWKSCPKCSVADGRRHMFYDYPGDFGTSDARVSDDSPDGAQSYCATCRGGETVERRPSGRPCDDVMKR